MFLKNKLPGISYKKIRKPVCEKQLAKKRTCLLLVMYKLICMIEQALLHLAASKLQIPK